MIAMIDDVTDPWQQLKHSPFKDFYQERRGTYFLEVIYDEIKRNVIKFNHVVVVFVVFFFFFFFFFL